MRTKNYRSLEEISPIKKVAVVASFIAMLSFLGYWIFATMTQLTYHPLTVWEVYGKVWNGIVEFIMAMIKALGV